MAEAWAEAILADRRREREALLAKARAVVEDLAPAGDLLAAVVYGSVARGDFNVWSDVDLLLVMRSLPANTPDRRAALVAAAPSGVQIVIWSPDDFVRAYRAGNPIAREALAAGVVLHGDRALQSLAGTDG